MSVKKIAVLFSGKGSNLLSILEKLHNKTFNGTTLQVVLTITNKKNAGGIKHCEDFGIKPVIIEHKDFNSREEFDEILVKTIKDFDVDLVVLAGFMRILTKVFTSQVRAINLHPSLLPLFKGANALQDSYNSDMLVGGVSVHFVSKELDGGKLIAQEAFSKEGLSFEQFEAKIHDIEHELLPKSIVKLLC